MMAAEIGHEVRNANPRTELVEGWVGDFAARVLWGFRDQALLPLPYPADRERAVTLAGQ